MGPGAALAEGREVPRDSSQAQGRGQHRVVAQRKVGGHSR